MTPITIKGIKSKPGRKIDWEDSEYVGDYVEAAKVGQVFTMHLGPFKKPKTNGTKDDEGNQLGGFFGPIMKVLLKEVYFTVNKDEAYIRCLQDYSYDFIPNPRGGAPLKRLIHVSDMDRAQMAEFIDRVLIGTAEALGVYIPNPDPKKSRRWEATFKARGYAEQDFQRAA